MFQMAMSSVLAAMASSNMVEGSSCKIEIPDFPFEIVKAFFEFLYMEHLPSYVSCEDIIDLWALGDKYDVPSLRCHMEQIHAKTILHGSVLTQLLKADQFGAGIIKGQLVDYVVQNKRILSENADFETLPKHLIVEIIRAIP